MEYSHTDPELFCTSNSKEVNKVPIGACSNIPRRRTSPREIPLSIYKTDDSGNKTL